MATNSRIAVLKTNGQVESIYVHNDGYILSPPKNNYKGHLGVGGMIFVYYNSQNKAEELVSLGNLSAVYENINTEKPHSFSKPQPNVCIAYSRDRNEKHSSNIFESLEDFEKFGSKIDEGTNYLFKDDKWYIKNISDDEPKYNLLEIDSEILHKIIHQ
jgi:hypothetical protein